MVTGVTIFEALSPFMKTLNFSLFNSNVNVATFEDAMGASGAENEELSELLAVKEPLVFS